jgi:hypothetical protein
MFTNVQNFNNEIVVNQIPTTNCNVVLEQSTLDQIEKGTAGYMKKSFLSKFMEKNWFKKCFCC